MRATVFLALTFLGLASASTYNNFKVYKFTPQNHMQNVYINSLAGTPGFDFWSKINNVGNPVTLMVAPRYQTKFEDYLKVNSIFFDVEVEDVGASIEAERNYHLSRTPLKSGKITFDAYLRHEEINNYLDQLARDNPQTVTVETIGQSYEGRDMKLIRISTGSGTNKPVIFVDAGIHAREWIAPATALYLINQLVENPENQNLIDNIDWVILPSVNPDGYEYSWTTDRLWRKTVSPGLLCRGCDPNRNFDFHWMETGASSWECSETYAGNVAFSEVETRNLRDYLLNLENVKAYLTLHSYGQYLLYPWGYSSDLPDNWQELDNLGHQVGDAIRKVSGTSYTVGSSTNVLYAAAGASDDWAMGVANIKIVYTIELPGGGTYGFDLPSTRIQGVVTETFEGFKVIADYVVNAE